VYLYTQTEFGDDPLLITEIAYHNGTNAIPNGVIAGPCYIYYKMVPKESMNLSELTGTPNRVTVPQLLGLSTTTVTFAQADPAG